MRGCGVLVLLASAVARAEPVPLDSLGKAADLCMALQPVERMRFDGGPTAIADERTKHRERRQAAMEQEYRVTLAGGEFRVAELDTATGDVVIDTSRPLRALGGALTVYDIERDELKLAGDKDKIAPIRDAIEKGRATLALTLRPAEQEGNPCLAGTAKVYTLGADFLAAELRDGDAVIARGTEEDDLAGGTRTAGTPTVDVVPVAIEGGAPPAQDIAARVEKLKPDLRRCYEQGLARNPALDGAVVFGIEVARGGKPRPPSLVADSVQDEEVSGCVAKTMAALALPGGKGPYKATLAIHLNRR